MRCDEVMRELGLPVDEQDHRALADHLAECQACARWSEHATTFNRLWNGTRPVSPSPESWDQLWSSVATRLDHDNPASPADVPFENLSKSAKTAQLRHTSPLIRTGRGIAALGLVALAQAAALVLAVNLYWNAGSPNAHAPTVDPANNLVQRTVPSLDSVVDVEWGQVPLIRTDGPEVKISDLAVLEPSNGDDPWYEFYNRVESASAVVAMTE